MEMVNINANYAFKIQVLCGNFTKTLLPVFMNNNILCYGLLVENSGDRVIKKANYHANPITVCRNM